VETLYKIADIFFFVFHISLILFNLFGWLIKPWRKWNLITLGLTAFSWMVLGAFYGFGYCFLTDWHWAIREELGYATPYNSYIHFLISELLPITVSAQMVDLLTGTLFFVALLMSGISNLKDYKKSKL
jgi:hypothetical protein